MNAELSTRSVVIERELPHAPEKIWRALTQAPLIEQWLMQNDFEPIEGRRFHFRAPPQPNWNGVTDCEVVLVEPPTRLAYTWSASGEQAATGPKTVVTWTLTSTKSGTLVRMEHSGFAFGADKERFYQGANYGWQRFVASLEKVVAAM